MGNQEKAAESLKANLEAAPEQTKKLPYPKSVFFIIGNEFCERFSYYGMKTILSLYLKKKLHFSEDKATVIYHTFSTFCYFTPIYGSILADMFLGKFKTIVSISVFYVLGHLLKTLASIPTLGVPPVEFSLVGLALIAIGTGGIKPCVSAFGGDQFKLPEQTRQLQTFFSVFYFAINAGSLISTFLTPALREDVHCFGEKTCYSLAFGVPAILMFIATVVIIIGRPLYVMKPPQGNVIPSVFGSVFCALKEKIKGKKAEHWLDLAKTKYESSLVEDVKSLTGVLVLYLPLPIWWALFDQTGSRWTFQASRMNGHLGSTTIKPDQMQVINPLLILFLIPIFDRVIYPVFAKFGLLVKPLQRMTAGGLLTACSFFISGILELQMMKTYAKVPGEGVSNLFMMNSLPCHIEIQLFRGETEFDTLYIPEFSSAVQYEMVPGEYRTRIQTNTTCLPDILNIRNKEFTVVAKNKKVSSFIVSADKGSVLLTSLRQEEDPEKDDDSNGKFRVIQDMLVTEMSNDPWIQLNGTELKQLHNATGEVPVAEHSHHGGGEENEEDEEITLEEDLNLEEERFLQHPYRAEDIGTYSLLVDLEKVGDVNLEQGGVYTVLLTKNPATQELEVMQYTLTEKNSIHMLWLVPQYVVITVGEIMFSITGLEFSYSQAPDSMKSVLQAAWLLTVAFGNIIVIIVAEAKSLNQANEFFMFACLMIVDMFLFAFLAWRYVPRKIGKEKSDEIDMEPSGVSNSNFSNEE